VTILFYRRDVGGEELSTAAIPTDATVRIWRPSEHGFPPRDSLRVRNIIWWGFSSVRLFARRDFTELTIWREDRLLHRLIVTPRWYRFPFMERGDLQLGDLWTCPNERGRGLARAAVAETHRHFAARAERFWYVVDAKNEVSVRFIESCGYRLVGTGERTSPFGLRALGRFRLDTPAFSGGPPK
jgi:RimJ/RimL family protein N-acetyltransferase